MHIALFNRSFYPETTATAQLLTELCADLVTHHGCRVTGVAGAPLDRASRFKSRESHSGVEIVRCRGTRFSKSRFIGRAANYVSYFLSACYAALKLDRPDVVVAATDPPIIGLAAYLASRRFGAPFVMIYQDVFPEAGAILEDFHSTTVNRALQRVNCFLAARASRNVALGESMRRRLIKGKGADPLRTVVIPNWADCSAIVPTPRQNAFSRAHGLDEKFVVMHSGNIGLAQALDRIVDAAERLKAIPDICFVFIGDGVRKPALEARVRALGLTNVRFLPYQPKETLKDSFGAADLFVISLKRGLTGYIVPSKLYGILAAGRGYVAAMEKESEAALLAEQRQCGLVADPDSAAQIADCILTLYHDRPVLRQYGENARDAAYEFDRRAQIRAYFTLFQELVSAPSA